MERYEKYKPSGIEWIGEVPEHWELKKIKFCFDVYAGATPKTENHEYWDGDIVWVTPADYKTEDKYINGGKKTITKKGYDSCNTQIVPVGSIIFSKRAPIGTVALSNVELCTNQGCLSCVPKGTNSTFYYYAMSVSTERFDLLGSGATFKEISADSFSNVKMPYPTLAEQEAIAAYLDARCADIDKVVATQEKRIALLKELKQSVITQAVTRGLNPDVKMKDSSVEWIGEVPEHWEICRLKNTLKENLMYGANESAECDNPDFPRYIRITDMTDDGKLRDETFKSLEPEKAKPYLLKRGDMLFARSGATVGKTFLFDMDIEACFAGYLIKASFNKTTLPKYVYYYSQSGIYENWKNSVFIQATIQNIGAEKYANLPFIRPNIEEQRGIVKYLDSKCEEIDRQINGVTRQIDLLREYKQSLITEVVTGKRKVY